MKQKLYDILQIIEEHFNNEVWKSQPPLSEKDYKLLMLAISIIKVKNNIDNIKDINFVISQIMTNIEQEFNVPLLEKDIEIWIKENEIRHKVAIKVYRGLSNLRSL